MRMLILFNASKGLSTFWIPASLTFQIAFFWDKALFHMFKGQVFCLHTFCPFSSWVEVLFTDIYKY